MSNIMNEDLLSFTEASRALPRRLHVSTLYRWSQYGLSNGTRLESIKLGGMHYTSKEALIRFIGKLNSPGVVNVPTSARATAAAAELAKRGA